MGVTPEQLDALERWAAQSPFPVVNIAAEYKAQKERIAALEVVLREVAADDDPRHGCAHSDSAKRALAEEEP